MNSTFAETFSSLMQPQKKTHRVLLRLELRPPQFDLRFICCITGSLSVCWEAVTISEVQSWCLKISHMGCRRMDFKVHLISCVQLTSYSRVHIVHRPRLPYTTFECAKNKSIFNSLFCCSFIYISHNICGFCFYYEVLCHIYSF